MIQMTAVKAAEACGGVLNTTAGTDLPLGRVMIDSRAVEPGDLFVAYKGSNTDGHRYIGAAFDRGAACCLAEYVPEGESRPVITVPDVQAALEQIICAARKNIKCPVIGITGSVGKTTAKEMISSVLSAAMPVLRTEGNLNNQIGVPMTLSRVTEAHRAAVVEMGISGFGEMTALAKMARPDIAVYTVIGHAHLEFLHDLDGVLRAKTEMLDEMAEDAVVVFNGDDEKQRQKACRQRKVYYGLAPDCDVRAESVASDGLTQSCVICYEDRRIPVKIPAFGRHMIYAALEGAAVGLLLGLSDRQIADGIAAYQTLGRRGSMTKTEYLTLVDDSYNGNPDSVKSSIDSMKQLTGRRVFILGDMLELGENSPAMHREVGQYAAEAGADLLLAVGPLAKYYAEGAGKLACWFPTVDELIGALPRLLRKGDAVLVQASRGMRLDLAAEAIKTLEPVSMPCLLFDLDDTILDFHKAESIAVAATFSELGIEPTEETIRRYSEINEAHWKRLERGELTRPEVLIGRFRQLFEELGVKCSGAEAAKRYENRLKIGHYFMNGAEELLQTLRGQGYRLFIVSNGTASVQDSRLASAGIAPCFDGIFISERIGADKPSREFFERSFAAMTDVDLSRTILIGDSLTSDILGGKNAGLLTCWFNPKHKKTEGDIIPDYEIDALSELPELLHTVFNL